MTQPTLGDALLKGGAGKQSPKSAAPPFAPVPFYWVRIEYRDTELGDLRDRAEAALTDEARAAGLWVNGVHRSPTRVLKVGREEHGQDKEGNPLWREFRVCEVYSLLDTETRPGQVERWVRLTTKTGPAAVEVLDVPQSALQALAKAGVRRTQIHQQDLRSIATGYARTVLEEG